MTYPSPYPTGYPPGYFAPGVLPSGSRPGLVTAIGVMSIIVASISLIAGLISAAYIHRLYAIGQEAANRARSMTGSGTNSNVVQATPAVIALPTAADLQRDAHAETQRLEQRRDTLVENFAALVEMTASQRQQLSALLGRYSDRILPHKLFESGAVSQADLRAAVRKHGVMPAPSPNEPETAYFELPAGRIELYGDRGIFRPGDGTANLRVAAPPDGKNVDGLRFTLAYDQKAANASSGGAIHRSGLNDQQVEKVIQVVIQQFQAGYSLTPNPLQLATIRQELRDRRPPLVTAQNLHAPVSQVLQQPDQTLVVKFTGGFLAVDQMGGIQLQISSAVHEVAVDPIVGVLTIGEFVGSALLAIFLLASGIMLLKNSPRAGGMHWIYAALKLPMAVLFGVTFVWMGSNLMSGVARMGVGRDADDANWFVRWGVGMAIVAAIYPLVLMIVLSTPGVRQFFQSERTRAS